MSYDARLLEQAPEISRAEKQEGYNVDLLDRSASVGATPHQYSHAGLPLPVSTPAAPSTAHGVAPYRKPKFWQTLHGRVIIGIVALAVLAAIIGGAVGGVLAGKNKNDKKPLHATTTTAPTSDGGIGQPQGGTITETSSNSGNSLPQQTPVSRINPTTTAPIPNPTAQSLAMALALATLSGNSDEALAQDASFFLLDARR
ncbi:hypothetical protein BKA62DRAFT_768687 [Auriculariales sp. MPI-PUGE-AT-0066]|nr:hypothetical protein BKA62DRAFT_768687 [Auriculariales sp. MPI-PUGE-AT-0066]